MLRVVVGAKVAGRGAESSGALLALSPCFLLLVVKTLKIS